MVIDTSSPATESMAYIEVSIRLLLYQILLQQFIFSYAWIRWPNIAD
jgi:hypothetical protein